MSRLLTSLAIAAAVASGGLLIEAGGAASAPLSPGVVQQAPAATNAATVENVQWRRGWRRGGRGIGFGIGAGLLGGALIGSAIAGSRYYYDSPYYYRRSYYYGAEPAYAEPVYDDPVAYCASRFRSYDPSTGTYLGYDGLRHPCP
jgi:hypothetical protein